MLKGRPRPTTPSKSTDPNAVPSTPILKERSPEKRSPPKAILRSPAKSHSHHLLPPHWSKAVKEVTVVTSLDSVFNFRISGGSDHGEFPVISDVLPPDTRGVEYRGENELVTQVGFLSFFCNFK